MANISVGSTLTSGIQDISALLLLLGTVQCEHHVGSALTNGYLYAAATPMSIFGSLGMARAGFKGIIASISSRRWRFIGAQKLEDTGFSASGTNLSLIMMDPNHGRRHLAETKLDSFLEALHIDDVENLTVVTRCFKWNFTMLLLRACLCILGLTPYIHLNLGNSVLPRSTRLVFPIVQVVGSFLTASSLQFLLQLRLVTILKNRLAFRAVDAHIKAYDRTPLPHGVLWDPDTSSELCLWSLQDSFSKHQKVLLHDRPRRLLRFGVAERREPDESSSNLERGSVRHKQEILKSKLAQVSLDTNKPETIWPFLIMAMLGITASVVGYIGCFSVVQGSVRPTGPLVWLAVEGGLSVIRMVLWGWNPAYDDLDPLIFSLKLNQSPPLTLGAKSQADFRYDYSLPLMRATEFLPSVTAYAGLVKRFDYPSISLFYTLLSEAARAPGTHIRTLCITIFHHGERTTRIYYLNSDGYAVYRYASDVVGGTHNSLQTTIGSSVLDPSQDSIFNHQHLLLELQEHYRSILFQLKLRDNQRTRQDSDIENKWTLDAADSQQAMEREDPGNSDGKTVRGSMPIVDWNAGRDRVTATSLEPDETEYLKQADYGRKVGRLYKRRGCWIEHYMEYIRAQPESPEEVKHDDTIPETGLQEWMLLYERVKMESILLEELQKWEGILWEEFEQMMACVKKTRKFDSPAGWKRLKERLQNEWNVNVELRLTREKDTTNARLAEEMIRLDRIQGTGWERELKELWKSVVEKLQNARRMILLGHMLQNGPTRLHWNNYHGYMVRKANDMALILHRFPDEVILLKIQVLGGHMSRERMERLRWQRSDMINRVKREVLHNCDDFWTSKSIAILLLGRSKWTKLDCLPTYSAERKYFKAIPWALQTSMSRGNRIIFFVQFPSSMRQMKEAISIIHETSVTTAVFGPDAEIEERTRAALLRAVTKNKSITSISRLDLESLPEIKQQIAHNQEHADPEIPSITAHGFLIGEEDDDLHGGLESRLDWRFMGPSTGPLFLRLQHRFKMPPRIRMNDAVDITCPAGDPESELFHSQAVKLEPNRDFSPDSPNVLCLISADEEYVLREIDLLDGEGEPYIYVASGVNSTSGIEEKEAAAEKTEEEERMEGNKVDIIITKPV